MSVSIRTELKIISPFSTGVILFFLPLKNLDIVGLNGIEVSSPRYGLSRQKELLEISKKLKLINSGGSDFHGFHKGIEIDSNNGINQKEYEKLLRALN